MAMLDVVKRMLQRQENAEAKQAAGNGRTASPPPPAPLVIPEISAAELKALRKAGEGATSGPRLLDCRETFEWTRVRIPGSLHIPMNQIPARLPELARDVDWVVVCAHGNRSYSVAGYLIQQGFRASSLAGGVTDWWIQGGDTESDSKR